MDYSQKVLSVSNPCKAGNRPCADDTIHFSNGVFEEILQPHEDLLIINVDIRLEHRITKVMVDLRSLVIVIYYEAFEKMDYKA